MAFHHGHQARRTRSRRGFASRRRAARGRGVRLQRYKDGGLCDVKTFKAADGLSWTDAAGRVFTLSMKDLADWRGNRADAGRIAPKGFPRSNKFGS